MLVTLPDGILHLRSEPGVSDNVKINVFFFTFAYRGVDKAVRRLVDARNLPHCEKRVIRKRTRQNDAYVSLSD